MLYLWAGIGRRADPTDIEMGVWWDNLNDLTAQGILDGMRNFIRNHSAEYVSVQKIRELSGAQASGDTAAVSAWDEVLKAIKHYGGYQTPVFSDPRIAATIRHLGGWIRLCDTESEEIHKWTRQTFLKTYAAMPATAEPARLTNLIELENARTGQTEAAAEIQRRIELRQEDIVLLQVATMRRDLK